MEIGESAAAAKDASSTQSDASRDERIWLSRQAAPEWAVGEEGFKEEERQQALSWIRNLPEARQQEVQLDVKECVIEDFKVCQDDDGGGVDDFEDECITDSGEEEDDDDDPLDLLCNLILPEEFKDTDDDEDEWIVSLDPEVTMAGLFSEIGGNCDGKVQQDFSVFSVWSQEEVTDTRVAGNYNSINDHIDGNCLKSCASPHCMEAFRLCMPPYYNCDSESKCQHGPYSWLPRPTVEDNNIDAVPSSAVPLDHHSMERMEEQIEALMLPDRLASPGDHLVLLCLEVWAPRRLENISYLLPDPKVHPIRLAAWTRLDLNSGKSASGVLECCSSDDLGLIEDICEIARDADILLGYYVEARPAMASSWEYVNRRAAAIGRLNLVDRLSRRKRFKKESDLYPLLHRIDGRMVGSVWRLLSNDAVFSSPHNDYSFEAIVRERLGIAIPAWQDDVEENAKWYLQAKTRLSLALVAELFGRSCEFARLFGLASLEEVFTRGSQYRVESLMMRMSRLEGKSTSSSSFLAVSPSRAQVKSMMAARAMPLTLEPASGLWVDPVMVFDFQSLYPSLMISHNYCFTTCLGRSAALPCLYGAGCWMEGTGLSNTADVRISPSGTAFVGAETREGLLPRMLSELLQARVQVKGQMRKIADKEGPVYRRLNASQLGLKYMANVIYGYTGAAFSGRMPSVEVADSIVSSGRAALQRAIRLVQEDPRWLGRLEVLYGDTDSLFVRLLPRPDTKDALNEARQIGKEIAEMVTAAFPRPMRLVFEKIYWPCLPMSKKRYAGWRWEPTRGADEPEHLAGPHALCLTPKPLFEAKGTESIRRDSAPLVGRILGETLDLLFRTRDLSLVREFLTDRIREIRKACNHPHLATISWGDLVIRRAVRSPSHYKGWTEIDNIEFDGESEESAKENGNRMQRISTRSTRLPPAALVAIARQRSDPNDGVTPGERVPFLVIDLSGRNDSPQPLSSACVDPGWFVRQRRASGEAPRPSATYYIWKQVIPALNRALLPILTNNSAGETLQAWWRSADDDCMEDGPQRRSDETETDPHEDAWKMVWRRQRQEATNENLRRSAWNCCRSTVLVEECLMGDGVPLCWSLSCPLMWRSVQRDASDH